MKRLFNTNFNNGRVHFMLLVMRIAIACFIFTHGYQKFEGLMAEGEVQFGDPIGIGASTSLILTVFAECFCAILILLGLATRLALVPLIVTMLVAILIVHAPDGFDKKELASHFLLGFVFLLVTGPGKYSIDNIISDHLSRRRR